MIFHKHKMQDTNIIGDAAKDRRINYDLIDRLNKECEAKARKAELEGRLAGKKKKEEEARKEPAAEPAQAPDIIYIKTPDELREIKGNYSLQKGIYNIDFEIIVPQGNALILQPGVELYFTRDVGITCEGRFEARGKDGLEVLLTAKDEKDGWQNLYLKGGAVGVLDYAVFSYGKGRRDKNRNICGGAILVEPEKTRKPTLRINNSYFEDNSAHLGGMIYNNKGNVTIDKNNRFEKNSAKWGGAIYNDTGNVTIDKNNIFGTNFADWGGVIYNSEGNVRIDKNNIFGNNFADWGGAIYNNRGNVRIKKNNIFKNNNSEGLGGAIYNREGTLDIDKSKNTFIGNQPQDIFRG